MVPLAHPLQLPLRRLLSFPTSEHYMMYHKALLMNDTGVAAAILSAPHPSEAKALGRQVSNFDEEKWQASCDEIATRGNYLKFSQSERLRLILLHPEEREIVETSPNDRFWGIGFNTEDAEANVEEWGENRLGKALMKVREMLRGERKGRFYERGFCTRHRRLVRL